MWKITAFLVAAVVLMMAGRSEGRPSYLATSVVPATYAHLEYAPTVIGHTVHHIPTAVSHQSQTIVHEKRPYLRPIVEHTPLLTYGSGLSYAGYPDYYDAGWSGVSPVAGVYAGWPLK